jgi:predicted transcriptional regulator of viral defense system
MMGFMGVRYYIGWLSAAALHGSAHHSPQATQVATSHSIRQRTVGRVRLIFCTRSNIGALPTVSHTVRSGRVVISTPEVTALDLCSDIGFGGGIGNVGTAIVGLSEEAALEADSIIALSQYYQPAAIRRLGWLLDHYTEVSGLDELAATAAALTRTPSLLDPSRASGGTWDRRWMIRVNGKVEIEE